MKAPALLRVSVIVPVRDDAERLRRCLASIRANRYDGNVEIIVVDNGSRDDSADVARAAGATVLSLPRCRVSELRNAAAAPAHGDVLAFIDADHVIDEAWMAAAAGVLGTREIAAGGAPCVPPPDGNWVQRAYDRFRSHQSGIHDVDWLGSGNLAVRRDAFVEVGGFDTSLETCEDVDLCNRFRAAGYRIVSDDRMRSIHFGDPSSLGALFRGELWRGRDNVRTTMRGPFTLRSLASLAIPIANLLFLTAIVFGTLTVLWLGPAVLLWATSGLAFLSLCQSVRMTLNADRVTLRDLAANFAVASVYNLARALALVVRTPHRTRRKAAAIEA